MSPTPSNPHGPLAWLRRLAEEEGPTHAFELMRVGFVLIVWSEWGRAMELFRDLTPGGVALSLSFWTFTGLLFAGLFTRLGAVGTAVVLQVIFWGRGYVGGEGAWVHHHSWTIVSITSLLALAPVGRVWSLDAWLADAQGSPLSDTGPLWARRLIGLQIANVYFWGAWDKTSWAFLSGERLQHAFAALYWTSDPLPAWVAPLCLVLAVLTVVIEYALPFTMWSRRLLLPSLLVGVVLHALFYVLIPVGTFSVAMLLAYLAYLPPGAVRDFALRR